jgi:hypothetical protein
MPPPPPSKSYLLVIDTDSEDEDDQEERHRQRQQQLEQRQRQQELQERQQQQVQTGQAPAVIVPPSPMRPRNEQHGRTPPPPEHSPAAGHRRPHALEDFDTEDDDSEEGPFTSLSSRPPCTEKRGQKDEPMITSTTISEDKEDHIMMTCTVTEEDEKDTDETTLLSKSQKKNKKKRQHKKKKKRSGSPSEDDHGHANKKDLRVTFSDVSIQNYNRCFGADVVPGDGGWPLGMELKPPGSTLEEKEEFRIQLPLEEYEALKQERLQARWEIVQEKYPNEEAILKLMTKRPTNDPTPFALETRQWDYRSKVKNPLFRLLYEDDRRAIFLGQTVTAATPAPPTRRLRSASFEGGDIFQAGAADNSSGSGPSSTPSKRRTRSNSVAESNSKSGGGGGNAFFSDTYDQVFVHHVRNELEQIRVQRSTEGAMGCSCRKLSVYIPPKDGGGKKAQHRRLKPQKLILELKKRNLFDPKASREDMELVLHKAVQDEPCCGRDCPCHKDGVECQADTCSCWYDSHNQVDKKSQGTTTNSHNALAVSEIQKRCGNQYGMNAVDGYAIDGKRVQILSFLNLTYCQPVAAVV